MASRIRLPLALLALGVAALAGPARAAAQSGGTPVPGPGDPCPAVYPGDGADKKALARWMARAASMRDLPEQLPVMAGFAESGLRNLNIRGNPFAGFFSMHRSLNRGPYRGFPRNPDLQLRWFTETAVAVRQRKIAEGEETFGADPSGYGLWIAGVERPVRKNRAGYQPYLDDASALLEASTCRPADHQADVQPPHLQVKVARRQRNAIVVSVRCPTEPCMAAAQALPARRVRRARAVPVEKHAVTLTLPASARRSVRLVVTVTAVDEAGNATRTDSRVTLLR